MSVGNHVWVIVFLPYGIRVQTLRVLCASYSAISLRHLTMMNVRECVFVFGLCLSQAHIKFELGTSWQCICFHLSRESMRGCIGYQVLNLVAILDEYSIIWTDNLFSQLLGASVFSENDLLLRYHWLLVREKICQSQRSGMVWPLRVFGDAIWIDKYTIGILWTWWIKHSMCTLTSG